MKIEQDVPDLFHPVVLTLENMQEVISLLGAINSKIDVLDGNPEFQMEADWLATIANFLEDVS